MIALLHTGTELRRFGRLRMTKVAIAAICIMPILYSTLYLWSYWNPFGNLANLPVALVNSDRGAEVDGERLDAGAEVAAGLREDGSLRWAEVDHAAAMRGVHDGTYYFAVELPGDFSEAVASPMSDDPRQATLNAVYNDANGYLSTIIGENAMREVLNAVDSRIGAEAVDKLLVGMVDAGMGLSRAAEGAGELDEGLGTLHDGSGELVDGLTRAKDGTTRLAAGTGELRSGVGELAAGTGRLVEGTGELTAGTGRLAAAVNSRAGGIAALQSGADRLREGTAELGAGAARIDSGVGELKSTVDSAAAAQSMGTAEIRRIAEGLRLLPDPASRRAAADLDAAADRLDALGVGPASPLVAGVDALAAGTGELSRQLNDPAAEYRGGIEALAAGTDQLGELVDGVNRLDEGAHRLAAGAAELDAGVGRLSAGAAELDDGATQLDDGATRLLDGGRRLDAGLGTAREGAHELATGLAEGAEQVPSWSEDERRRVATVMGGPVDVSSTNDAGDNSFGGGLAPFFFTLALYIGGIIAFLLLRPLHRRAVSAGVPPLRAAIDGLVPAAVIGIAQTLVIFGTTMLVTPLRPATVAGLALFGIVVSVMFMAINQMFNVALGAGPGKVAAMAFLMIQVVSSGGLYPVETQPAALQWLHPLMPMTYAVQGLRQVLYGDYDPRMAGAVVACLAVTAGAVALTALAARRDRVWTMQRLHPPIAM